MPLIDCPDCGRQISDEAPACIHCGRPFYDQVASVAPPRAAPPPVQKEGCFLQTMNGCCAVVFGIFALGIIMSFVVGLVPERSTKRPPKQTLKVEAVRAFQFSETSAKVELRFTNTSTRFLVRWSVDVKAYDAANKYLGAGSHTVLSMTPRDVKTVDCLLSDVQAEQIAKYEFVLGEVVDKTGTTRFELED